MLVEKIEHLTREHARKEKEVFVLEQRKDSLERESEERATEFEEARENFEQTKLEFKLRMEEIKDRESRAAEEYNEKKLELERELSLFQYEKELQEKRVTELETKLRS